MVGVLITYDDPTGKTILKNIEDNYKDSHQMVTESCYVVKTKDSLVEVLGKVSKALPDTAPIMVTELSSAFVTSPNLLARKWLEEVTAPPPPGGSFDDHVESQVSPRR